VSFHVGKEFLEQETGQGVVQAVKLEAAIKPRIARRVGRVDLPRACADADGHRHFVLVDEVVEHHGRREAQAVQPHVDAGRLVALVLGRDIDGDRTAGPREDLRAGKRELEGLARRHVRLALRIRTRPVIVSSGNRGLRFLRV
jgi:hypothetical protein